MAALFSPGKGEARDPLDGSTFEEMNLLKSLKYTVYSKTSQYFSDAVLVEGSLKGTTQPFRCLVADNSGLNEYLLPKVYAEPPRVIRRWKIWIPQLKRLIQNR